MNRDNLWFRTGSFRPAAMMLATIASIATVTGVQAAERQFLVMLAYSPKQFADNDGVPPGGLTNKELIYNQYFDDSSSTIGSFAEYWKEISYGDVTISGDVKGWIALPWSTQPQLDEQDVQITPANYFDLDDDNARYTYGAGEHVRDVQAAIRDFNGDPGGFDDGPFEAQRIRARICEDSGRRCQRDSDCDTATNERCLHSPLPPDLTPSGRRVWMPGERFVDVDEDGKWDGLDEANNLMDWNGDNRPDLLGPWIDLNLNGEPDNNDGCLYLADDDNDGNPNCCPDGPGMPGCFVFDSGGDLASNRCPATTWEGPDSSDWQDCNGNLIPDACDVSCGSTDCLDTGWLGSCGDSRDELPLQSGIICNPDPDGTPDECQFVDFREDCVGTDITDTEDPCAGRPVCTPIDPPITQRLSQRCEFDDDNRDDELDVVEPWEDFLRRWDPCLLDPDASNGPRESGNAHWIKVYDPASRSLNDPLVHWPMVCEPEPNRFEPEWPGSTPADYDDTSYIEDNYPGTASRVISQAVGIRIWGEHDPLGKLIVCTCSDGEPCEFGTGLCPAGIHREFDPPDAWVDINSANGPNGTTLYTTKMRAAVAGRNAVTGRDMDMLPERTPEPGWYSQAWKDRYVNESHPKSEGCRTESDAFADCEEPVWPAGGDEGDENIPRIEPFDDVDVATYDPDVNRRYFHANAGGLNGNGTGWPDCGSLASSFVVFETGIESGGFEGLCDAPILPEEEENGASQPAKFYDGWVEHDDLPSSKYHLGGDQRFGEVTSPSSDTIWGEDLGKHIVGGVPLFDSVIEPAGPYATDIHGNFGLDAGNLMTMELLTWRTRPPFNNGVVWEDRYHDEHPYAGPSGERMGFRDYNLDGLIDQGEVRHAGSENYIHDSDRITPNEGTRSRYPFNRRRLLEDCVEVLDIPVDFDDWLDPLALSAFLDNFREAFVAPDRESSSEFFANRWSRPMQFAEVDADFTTQVTPDGAVSGIVLLPEGSHDPEDFNLAPAYFPIHTEDGDNSDTRFPQTGGSHKIDRNLVFHDLVVALDTSAATVGPFNDFQTRHAAHEYLHAWEGFPDLYDYDRRSESRPRPHDNTPVGRWGIMADGSLVHPVPILKQKGPSTEWIKPIDLTTVLTPGVESVITLPPAEFARDGYYYLQRPSLDDSDEEEDFERYYFWSAGLGFDEPGSPSGGLPAPGMLILHTDIDANDEALPSGQTNESHFEYLIVQADGLEQLEAGEAPFGDAGDPWPGSSENTRFNFDTMPPAIWNTQNSWTGLDITDVIPDGLGSALVFMKWVPTTIPSLSFIDPPGGSSVGSTYQVRVRATDVHGGTTIHVYYSELACSGNGAACVEDGNCPAGQECTHDTTIKPLNANLVGTLEKTTPGTNDLSIDWSIATIDDGRYRFFAELVPGKGADGRMEASYTMPRPGRNNIGDGSLTVKLKCSGDGDKACDDDADCPAGQTCSIKPSAARLETWTARLFNITASTTQKWVINGNISQPEPEDDLVDPDPKWVLEVPVGGSKTYESPGGEVKFTITNSGANFLIGDSWSFVTTGITALSSSIKITDGKTSESPVASIAADRFFGRAPMTVKFDGRGSREPNGGRLVYRWDFGDKSPFVFRDQVEHTYTTDKTFTVTLHVTSELTGDFDETSIDIEVTNNKPTARMTATPTSGPAPLTVKLSGAASADTETAADDLIYQWDFGDGETANDAGEPGVLVDTEHFYSKKADGTTCTSAKPCTFVAKLTVEDEGKRKGVDSIEIQVGNSNPVANISHSALQGPAPLEVVFNAENSTDEDGDAIKVEWIWGDGEEDETEAADGAVSHTFEDPGRYEVTAFLTDGRGGRAKWPKRQGGETVVVTDPVEKPSSPQAIFAVDPEQQLVGQPIEVNAEPSFDRPADGTIASYSWDWGDDSAAGSGVKATHVYDEVGNYTITLTVADAEDPPNTDTASKTASIVNELDELPGPTNRAPAARFIVSGGPVNLNEGIAGETVFTFDATSSSDPDGDDLKFDWFFDDDTSIVDGEAVVTHKYDIAREAPYIVRLTVRDKANLATNTSQPIIVRSSSLNQEPVALITTGSRSGALPLRIEFTTELSYDPDGDPLMGYAWYLDDGNNEVRLQVDAQGSWQGAFTGDVPEDATDDDLPVTICLGENRGARIFWTNVVCAERPNGTEDIEIRPSSNNGATLSAVFRREGAFMVSLEVNDGLAVGRGDAERVTVTARAAAVDDEVEDLPERPGPGGGGGSVSSGGLCGFGILIGILGSLFGLTVMMVASRRNIRFGSAARVRRSTNCSDKTR